MWRKCQDCGKRFSKKGGPGRRCAKCQVAYVKKKEQEERAEVGESIRIRNRGLGVKRLKDAR